MNLFLWVLFGYCLGSIPFAYILAKVIARADLRAIGDGNPGGANALKSGGLKVGIPAILLEIAKGFVPVALARQAGLAGWELAPVGLAPALGHAFSPCLGFRGGKALGATAGAWLGVLGLPVFPIYGILAIPCAILQTEDAWSACAGMLALLGYAIFFGAPWMVALAALNTMLIIWTHRHSLKNRPRWRGWVNGMLVRKSA